jgi:hypothetical protein
LWEQPRGERATGRGGIAEALVLIGDYTSVAMGMRVYEMPVPAGR